MKGEFDDRRWIDDLGATADTVRQRDASFVGLAGSFRKIAEKLRIDFEASAAIQHPGDKGTAREGLLREFLTRHGYLPGRYAVAEGSSHVLSSSGHISAQVDLVLYDALNAPRLLSSPGIQYLPIESCYGIIEAKSDLNSRERLFEALDNIASFKRLRSRRDERLVDSGAFGIVFAFTASLAWATIFEATREWEATHDARVWPNMIVILDHGTILHASDRAHALHTPTLSAGGHQLVAGRIGAEALLSFYLMLIEMLGQIRLPAPPLSWYASLPSTVGEHSYSFVTAPFGEAGVCKHHGAFARLITESAVARILSACPSGSQVDRRTVMRKLYGEEFDKLAGDVTVYNPDRLPDEQLLLRPALGTMAFEMVVIDGREYWLPDYYVLRDGLITRCPKCPAIDLSGLTVDVWNRAMDSRARPSARDEDSSRPDGEEPPARQ